MGTLFLIFTIGGLVLITGFVIFFYTARLRQSSRALEVERGKFRNIIYHFEDALILYDQNFKIILFNPEAERLFRLKAEAVVGTKVTPQDAENPARRFLAQVVFPSLAPIMVNRSEPRVYPQVVELSFSDPEFYLRVATNPLATPEGSIMGFIKIIRDRTRDVVTMKSKNEFIAVASHQLRTPLTGITWALESLKRDAAISQDNQTIIESALQGARQLSGIVEDLLMVAKIEEGRFGYNFESVDIVEITEKILGPVVLQARQAGINVYFEKPKEALLPAIVDREKITMVIENLLDNALRYNVKNGEVYVKVVTADEGPFLEVTVRDTGIGIPPDEIGRMFTKFYRAENATKFQTEGSGLGLYIAHNIVRAHGGRIWVESQLNRGTILHFTLATDPSVVPPKEIPLEY